jgi:hypothetical protein
MCGYTYKHTSILDLPLPGVHIFFSLRNDVWKGMCVRGGDKIILQIWRNYFTDHITSLAIA